MVERKSYLGTRVSNENGEGVELSNEEMQGEELFEPAKTLFNKALTNLQNNRSFKEALTAQSLSVPGSGFRDNTLKIEFLHKGWEYDVRLKRNESSDNITLYKRNERGLLIEATIELVYDEREGCILSRGSGSRDGRTVERAYIGFNQSDRRNKKLRSSVADNSPLAVNRVGKFIDSI